MEKKSKKRMNDKTVQCKHSPHRPEPSKQHNHTNHSSSNKDGSCSRSNADAMNGALTAVIEKTTTDELKLKEVVPRMRCLSSSSTSMVSCRKSLM